jgi:photosystem II stability/assembly factor-like uncharacterized protein
MTRYDHVISLLDRAIGGPLANIGAHGAFWRGLTRDQFVAKKVFQYPLLSVGHSEDSNLVKALRGVAPFGSDLPTPPPGAKLPRMPDGLPPMPDPDIAFISRWIDEGCLEDAFHPPNSKNEVNALPSSLAVMQWGQTKAPQASSRYDDVWFIDSVNGWSVNSNGQILHTTDGFETYEEQLHDPSVYMRCIAFASPNRGWVGSITEGKILYETSDGGRHWSLVQNLPDDPPVAVCGMWAVNEAVVYAAGSNHPEQPVRMMRTFDGGHSWTAWDMRPWADNLIDVYFTSADRGWVLGGRTDDPRDPNPSKPKLRPVVLYTEDGGRTWTDQVAGIRNQFPLGEWAWKIQFLDAQVGFISLQNYDAGAILTTNDGGRSWIRHKITDPQMNANLEGIGFINAQHGWIGGWGDRPKMKRTSSETRDGGETWRDANEIGRTINRFRFLGRPVVVGYAAGETIYRYSPAPPPAQLKAESAARSGQLLTELAPLEAAEKAMLDILVPTGARRLTVRVFDPDGPMVCMLLDEHRPATGRRTLSWDRTTDDGRPLDAHSYILRVTVDGKSESRLVCVK